MHICTEYTKNTAQ